VDVALRVADVVIVVVENITKGEQLLIEKIQDYLEKTSKVGMDKLYVVHNYAKIDDPVELSETFQRYVLEIYRCNSVEVPIKTHGHVLTYKYYKSERLGSRYPIYHFLLGRDGSKAGKQNQKTYDALHHLLLDLPTIGRARKRDIIADVTNEATKLQETKKEKQRATEEANDKVENHEP